MMNKNCVALFFVLLLAVPTGSISAGELYFQERITADSIYRTVRNADDSVTVFEETLPGNDEFGVPVYSIRYTHSIDRIFPPVLPDGQLQYVRLKVFVKTGGNNDVELTVDSINVENFRRRQFLVGPAPTDSATVESWPLDDQKIEVVLTSTEESFVIRRSDFDLLYIPGSPTGVDDDHSGLPQGYDLKPNYPNPFNPSTTIEYTLPARTRVRIIVYNMLGQEVKRLVDGDQSAGVHHIVWDGTDGAGNRASSGLYFYRIIADGYSQTRKMLFLK